ncbi:outer membrane protein assembly factor BamB family protein [Haloferax volcanii]|uniref:PQQ enzyme repeat domain protein n=3 Tax=Haloferax volcanii TaxID=2246 RepID=A0A384LAJ0_HALVD|nr:PQQ-binding-like beta-propeller repeat protein [Haloferax volcanii]ADE01275.1 PQQ repeat protein [Haloferax volcanii DS2]ELY36357.1 PQQ enzyme repeat domain protein [Haloferax volcanii DS2]MBS8120394.1 PQQ-binding-like beta-propeller repeat protein [Haloferax volcanii]MBS8125431.1 PQQ-binding-like beta-propeller repeat protein [Haloferax volcanii]MBS8129298.1 PQQ-binding-like beta-propeller repeat protein [Haloferax volcanii]
MKRTNRRRFLAAFSSSAFAFTAGCQRPVASASERHPVSEPVTSWPTFRGGRYNTGYIGDVSPLDSEPSVEWTFEAGDAFWGSPIVADGTVYIGSADSALYALDAETGEERWSFEAGHRIEGTPAYADGVVYVGSYDKHLYALDAGTGEERWSRGFGGLIRGSPTVWDGTVYTGVGCHNLACAWYAEEANVSETGWVYALDAETGETEWRYEVGDEVVSTPAVTNNRVYVGTSDEALYALSRSTGEVEWTYETRDMIWSSPAVAYGSVYFTDWNGNVHAADAATGEQEWLADTAGRYISGSVAVGEEAVYVGHTPYNTLDDPTINHAKVFRFDRESGAENWSFETPALEVGSSPVLTEDVLYVGTHRQSDGDGVGVHAITTDGQEEWFMEIDGRGVGSSPALVDGRLYFGGTDAKVYAVE